MPCRSMFSAPLLYKRAAFLLAVMVCVGLPLDAQQPASPNQADVPAGPSEYTFKTTVNRVVLDVVATDLHGKPVLGLTPEDFSIEEDGRQEQVLSFDTHRFDGAMDYMPPNFPEQPLNSFVNLPATPERGPLYVLLYDLDNIPLSDQTFARRQLIQFVKDKPAGARFAIFVCSDGMHLIQGFTSDERILLSAVDLEHPRPHMPKAFQMGINFGQGDKLAMAARLNFIAGYLKGLPGRKNLIWMASIFPLSLFPADDDLPLYREQVKKTLASLASNQISVYPVDTSGVILNEVYGAPGATSGGGLTSDTREKIVVPTGLSAGAAYSAATGNLHDAQIAGGAGYSQTGNGYMTQDEIAGVTGGKAFYGSNDLKSSLWKATEDGGTYYTLTYSPPKSEHGNQLRRIKVVSRQKGLHLAYRQAYFIRGPETDQEWTKSEHGQRREARLSNPVEHTPMRNSNDLLSACLMHGAPMMHQIIFRAQVRLLGRPAMGTSEQMARLVDHQNSAVHMRKPMPLQPYAIDYTVMAHQLESASAAAPNIEIAAAVYDAEGQMLNSTDDSATPDPANATANASSNAASNASSYASGQPGGASPRKSYRVEQHLDAPLDARYIRVAVRDANTDRVGAMEIDLPLTAENEPVVTP